MKPMNELTKGQINKALDTLDVKYYKLIDRLIAEGRGLEKHNETIHKNDPLSLEFRKVIDSMAAYRNEISLRYGPGAPSRLP